MFGSYARGDFTEFSDIDVCVVAERLPENIFERRSLAGLYKISNLRAIGYFPDEFLEVLRKPNLFLYDVLRDGTVIYSDGQLIEKAKRIQAEVTEELKLTKENGGWRFLRKTGLSIICEKK